MQARRSTFGWALALVAASCTPMASDDQPRAEAASATAVASEPLPAVELVRAGQVVALDEVATRVLVQRVEKGIAGCNFRSGEDPQVFGSVDLATQWTQRESAAHLRLRYPAERTIDAVVGKVEFSELLLAVDEPYGPEPALAKDARGVFGLKKCTYDDRMLGCAPELTPYFARPAACPPGW